MFAKTLVATRAVRACRASRALFRSSFARQRMNTMIRSSPLFTPHPPLGAAICRLWTTMRALARGSVGGSRRLPVRLASPTLPRDTLSLSQLISHRLSSTVPSTGCPRADPRRCRFLRPGPRQVRVDLARRGPRAPSHSLTRSPSHSLAHSRHAPLPPHPAGTSDPSPRRSRTSPESTRVTTAGTLRVSRPTRRPLPPTVRPR